MHQVLIQLIVNIVLYYFRRTRRTQLRVKVPQSAPYIGIKTRNPSTPQRTTSTQTNPSSTATISSSQTNRSKPCPKTTELVRCQLHVLFKLIFKRKRKRSDSVLWQKPIYQQKCHKGKVTTQTTPQKSSITQRLQTDLGRSVGVTTATQLVWLTWFTGPTFPLPTTAV